MMEQMSDNVFGTESNIKTLTELIESMGFSFSGTDGVRYVEKYSDVKKETEALYSGVGLRNISHYGIIELRGKDVLDFLHRISTNNIKDLQKEGIADTIFTTDKGRIIDVVKVVNFGDYQLLFGSPHNKRKLKSWISKYIIADDVQLIDANIKYNLLELSGPQAESFSTLLCGEMTEKVKPNSFKVISTEGMIFFFLKIQESEDSIKFWFLADEYNSKKLLSYFLENKGVFDFNLVGEKAYEIYRIERGIPAAPNELNDQFNPHEARLIHLVDFNKGCYIGQEVIARLDTYDKVQKYLCGIKSVDTISGNKIYQLKQNSHDAGRITSVTYSEKMSSCIGLAYIRREYSQPGTKLIAEAEDGSTASVVVQDLPFKK